MRSTRKKLKLKAILSLSIILLSFSGYALSYLPLTLEQAVKGATLIVHGTVMANQTVQTQMGIYTTSTFRVHESLKGSPGHTIYIKQSGGKVKELTQAVIGAINIQEGEEWVLFLTPIESAKTDEQQKTVYRIMVGSNTARQVIRDETGTKIIKTRPPKIVKRKPTKNPLLTLTKLHAKTGKIEQGQSEQTQPTKALSPKKSISILSHQDKTETLTRKAPKPFTLKSHLERLKKAIDDSQAPATPTH